MNDNFLAGYETADGLYYNLNFTLSVLSEPNTESKIIELQEAKYAKGGLVGKALKYNGQIVGTITKADIEYWLGRYFLVCDCALERNNEKRDEVIRLNEEGKLTFTYSYAANEKETDEGTILSKLIFTGVSCTDKQEVVKLPETATVEKIDFWKGF